MRHILREIMVPLLSLMILVTGSGFFATLISLILHDHHASHFIIGALSAAYYLGIVVGSLKVGPYILNAGSIRVYAACASFTAAIILVHGLIENPYLWIFMRFWSGVGMAGMFIVTESWVLSKATHRNRGQLLALYMIAVYITNATGQGLFLIPFSNELSSFCVASLLAAISIVPISITKISNPHFQKHEKMGFKKLVQLSPSALVGCFAAGMILGSVYGLLPSYGAERGLDTQGISALMGITLLGGTLLQFPIGRASDFISRQWVTLFVCVVLVISSIVIWRMMIDHLLQFLAVCFLFGGCAFTLYPLSISHMCDLIPSDKVIEASQGLLVCYGVGAVIGPLIAPIFISIWGYDGLMFYFISVTLIFIGFMLLRSVQKIAPPLEEQQEFVAVPPHSSLVLSTLDPRAESSHSHPQ